MTDTINNKIPFVPENTIDPAAGLNLSLNTIDALLQVLVQTVGANTPPTGVEGQRFIVGTAPTGAWAGQANKLARFLGGAWQFFDARYVLNAVDGLWYVRSAATWAVSAAGALADGSVTNAKLANVPTQTFKGRTTAANGVPEDITAAQARAILNVADGATANATNAQLRDRATHTGEQAISTVTGLVTELAGKQASNANLNALAGLAGAADRLPYFTGAGALALATFTAFGRSIAAGIDAPAVRATLGLGTAATTNAIDYAQQSQVNDIELKQWMGV